MSQIASVLKNKNSIERKNRQRRREELQALRTESAFRAKMHEYLKTIDVILEDDSVTRVIIEIPKNNMARFQKAIYTEEMAQYSIEQIDESSYSIGRRMLNF